MALHRTLLSRETWWLFNLGADIYAWFTAQAAWRTSCAAVAARVLDLRASCVLDLGCGPGVSTFELAERMPSARLIGLDIAPRMLAQARRRQRSAGYEAAPISWLSADAARLPIATGSVDACTAHSFLYLVADRPTVLAEVRRVLRPGGRLVLLEPNARPATPASILRLSRDPRHLISASLWRVYSGLHGRFSVASLIATLERAGFTNCAADETLGGLGVLAVAVAPDAASTE